MKQKFASALSLALIVAMLFTSVVLADTVVNTIDNTIDPATETAVIEDGTTSVYVGFYIKNQNTRQDGDPENSCNVSGPYPATVTFDIPAGVTASPSSLVFTGCDATQTVKFTSTTPDTYPISVLSVTGGKPGGAWDTAPAAFELEVEEPVNTAPIVSLVGVTNGAIYNKGLVPAATCQVTDTEDGNSSFAATLSSVTGQYANDGLGSQTASCSYTDGGDLTASASATYTIVDGSAPSISYVLSPSAPDGTNSWYKSDVTLTWTVTETESPNSLVKIGCDNKNINLDQVNTTYSCSATSAGGSAGPVTVSIKRDGTLPTISGSASPAANNSGWNTSDVTVTFTCNDNLSGLASCGPNQTLSSDGSNQSVTGTAVDNAGNSASVTVSGINIDKTAPSISCTVPDDTLWYRTDVTVNCTASDSGSGLLTPADATFSLTTNVLGDTETESASTNSKTIYDIAGNSAVAGPYMFKVDKKAPSFSCGSADGLWHADNVSIACTASDGGSGLATPASFSLSTNVAAGIEDANASTNSAAVTDNVGNGTTAGPIAGNKIDKKAPSITISVPTSGASYLLNQPVTAIFNCSDGGSGVANCTGPASVNTSLIGANTFNVNATDNVGNSNSASTNYTVAFKVCALYDQSKSHKAGSTVPVKLQLCDFNGANYSSSSIVVKAMSVSKQDNSASGILDDSGAANSPEMNFRYDAALGGSGGYIFNLSTKGLTTGTWKVTFSVNGTGSYSVTFDIK